MPSLPVTELRLILRSHELPTSGAKATFRGQLGFVQLDAGRPREALDSFERGLELEARQGSRRAELAAGRALALAALGDDRATQAAREALAGLGEGQSSLRAELERLGRAE